LPKWNGYANTRSDEVNHVSLMFHILPKLAFYQVKAELRCIISVYLHALLADLVTYLCSCVMGCASSPFTIHMHRALTSTHWRYLIRATQTFLSTTQCTTQTSTTSTIHHNNFYSSLSPTHPRYSGTCNRAFGLTAQLCESATRQSARAYDKLKRVDSKLYSGRRYSSLPVSFTTRSPHTNWSTSDSS